MSSATTPTPTSHTHSSVYVRTYAKDYELPPLSPAPPFPPIHYHQQLQQQTPRLNGLYSSSSSAAATASSSSSSSRGGRSRMVMANGVNNNSPTTTSRSHVLVEIAEQSNNNNNTSSGSGSNSSNNVSSITGSYNHNYDCYEDESSIQYETTTNIVPMINLMTTPSDEARYVHSMRPNRPYSYYLATNFNPLDFSNMPSLVNDHVDDDQTVREKTTTPSPASKSKQQSHYEKASGRGSKTAKSSTLTRSSRINGETTTTSRLSTSLSDMVKGKGDVTITNSPIRTRENRALKVIKSLTSTPISKKDCSVFEDDESYEAIVGSEKKLSARFQRATKLSSTMPTRFRSKTTAIDDDDTNGSQLQANREMLMSSGDKNKSHHKSLNKINKFFRTLFRINSQSASSRAGVEDDNKNNVDLVVVEDGEHHNRHDGDEESSRFVRMFSFKQNNNNKTLKYQYNTASRTTRVQSTTSSSSSSTTNSALKTTTTTTSMAATQELIVSDVQPSTSFALLPQIDPASLQSTSSNEDQYTSLVVNETSINKNLIDTTSSSSFRASTSSSSSPTVSNSCSVSSTGSNTLDDQNAAAASQQRAQIIMDEIDKAKRELTKIDYDQFRDKFYTQISQQMKSRHQQQQQQNRNKQDSTYFSGSSSTTGTTTSNNNEKSSISSIDSIDIPYIDDEEDECVECDQVAEFAYSTVVKSLSSSPNKMQQQKDQQLLVSSSLEESPYIFDHSDRERLHDLAATPSLATFDQLAVYYMNKHEFLWNKLSILFEMTNTCIELTTGDMTVVNKLKQLAAGYIHEKYCEWIYDDGWKTATSTPREQRGDLVSLPCEMSDQERIH